MSRETASRTEGGMGDTSVPQRSQRTAAGRCMSTAGVRRQRHPGELELLAHTGRGGAAARALARQLRGGFVQGVVAVVEDRRQLPELVEAQVAEGDPGLCLLYTSPSPRDGLLSRMPSS